MTTEYSNLALDSKVHRRVYTDADVFSAEMERVFGQAWLYMAHESQIAAPGDFVTAHVGNRPVIVSRHNDGKIYAFANRCTHRGMKVCASRFGSKKRFVCPYHGWAFSTDGGLIGYLTAKAIMASSIRRTPPWHFHALPAWKATAALSSQATRWTVRRLSITSDR